MFLTEPPRYQREGRPSLLDPHKPKVAELLDLDAEDSSTVIIEKREGG